MTAGEELAGISHSPSSAFGTFSPEAGEKGLECALVEVLLPSARGEGAEGG
jgi:hypothetical protein